jgi:hypothetical protein
MTIEIKRTGLPPELETAVVEHAEAMVAGDDRVAAKFGGDCATYDATLQRASSMRPFKHYQVIARARLGFQYLVKLRLCGIAGDLNLQNRWGLADDGTWRIVEIDDLGLRSPWEKPVRDATVNADGKTQ